MQRYLRKPPDIKVQSFTPRLIQLNTYLLYFLPDRPVTSLPNDDIKDILYHTMPNTWEKKMVEREYNYLDVTFYPMAEIFERRNENQEKSTPPSFRSRNHKNGKRGSKKRKTVTISDSEDED